MIFVKFFPWMLICLCIFTRESQAQNNSLTCQKSNELSASLRADNELLLARLEKLEMGLKTQNDQELDIAKELNKLKLSFQTMDSLLLKQQSAKNKRIKDAIDSFAAANQCNIQNEFNLEFKKFLRQQNRISKKFDIPRKNDEENDLHAEEIDCGSFYYHTLESLSDKIGILENIDGKLAKAKDKILPESQKYQKSIDFLPDVINQLDKKESGRFCVRTKEKKNVCSSEPYPSSCFNYDTQHCTHDRCFIKNFIYGSEPFQVACDQMNEGGGWLIIQRRFNGSLDFLREWSEYKKGFGSLDGEFWLGLDKIHALTATLAPVELLIQLTDHDDITKYAIYSDFAVGNETELYELKAAHGYTGNAGDSFSYHEGHKFSTIDRDNDISEFHNCAEVKTGAWWYDDCLWSNLNGIYHADGTVSGETGRGLCWQSFHGYKYSMKAVKMMIRPRNFALA